MVACKLAAAQVELGAEVGILSYAPRKDDASIIESLRPQPGQRAVGLHLIDHAVGRLESFTGGHAGAMARSVVGRYDVLHVHGVWEPMLAAVARVFARAGKPYVLCPHGMLDPWTLTQSATKKKIALALWVRRMLNNALFLHMLNKDEATLCGPLGLRARFEQIPNGVSPKEFANLPAPGSFYETLPAIRGKRYVLFMSRLHFKKGLDLLATAFASIAGSLPDVDLVVAGPDGGYQAPFVEMVKAAGITDRVHLTGPIYGQRKLAALVDAACFCLPSRQEGFSVAITESLATGTPVVVSRDCHYPEVTEFNLGVETALTPEAVAKGLVDTLARTDRDAMSARAKGLIAERFNWPMIAARSLELYADRR
jgi:glycosyltransferase involved in cell wall biosynthesis